MKATYKLSFEAKQAGGIVDFCKNEDFVTVK